MDGSKKAKMLQVQKAVFRLVWTLSVGAKRDKE